MVPLLILLLVYQYFGWALLIFLLAGITDMLDGLIARKLGRKTPLGTFLDPIADKILLVSSFAMLTFGSLVTFKIPLWLTITVISRDLLLVLSVLVINLTIGRRAFPPSILGKCTTVSQLFLIFLFLVANEFNREVPGIDAVIYLVLALTVASGLHYMMYGMRLIGSESTAS